MRLTVDVITSAPTSVNAIKQWQLSLRGLKIPSIENMGATKDQYDCIDMSDNEISILQNFPLLRRLQTLVIANNMVSRVADLGVYLPSLETLVLTNNRITNLSEIDNLASLASLRMLSLVQNPVQRVKHYRLYVIHKLPQLQVLDFERVKQSERDKAAKLAKSSAGQSMAAAVAKSREAVADAEEAKGPEVDVSTHAIFQAALGQATTEAQITQLEQLLVSGKLTAEAAAAVIGSA